MKELFLVAQLLGPGPAPNVFDKVPIPQSAVRVPNPGLCKRDRIGKRQLDLHSVTVEALISFLHVQLLAGYIAGAIQPRFATKTHGVYDQGVSLPMTNRMSHEG